jgi:hypothetical protein
MSRPLRAGVLGYLVFAGLYVVGVLLTWSLVDAPPFHPDTGHLTGSWILALLTLSGVAGVVSGWVCRRLGRTRSSVVVMIGVLVGLGLLVGLVEALIGPTPSARAFLEALFGPLPEGLPFAGLLEGRPRAWVALASYGLALAAMVAGAAGEERFGRFRTDR